MTPAPLPVRWGWLVDGFVVYARRYVRTHLHAVRLAKAGGTFPQSPDPLLVVLNHPGWWDPMICTVLSPLMPTHHHYAAIDAEALKKYPFFAKLGFFGVDTHSVRGAAAFLRTGEAVLSAPGRAVWVTAQGRFSDVRQRPLGLMSGVGHLAARMTHGTVLPLAFEYAFWTERTAEALVRVGEPLDIAANTGLNGKAWTAKIEAALTATLDALNADAMARDPARFDTVLGGSAGVGGIYDRWRRLKAWATGREFDAGHNLG